MSAKEMFEELGYEVYKSTKYELSYIYKKRFVIEFSHFNRMVRIQRKTNILNVFWFGRWEFIGIDMQEFKAIQQQIKELGWESDK